MRQTTLIIATVLLLVTLLGCEKAAPAHTMTDPERQKAQAIAGWWTSTQEDVGFSANLKPDGSGLVVFGTPMEEIEGPWWIASAPERIVVQRKDGTLAEFKILQAGGDSMKLQSTSGGPVYTLARAMVITPK